MKKMKVVLSIVLALSMLITIGALPSLAEGETGKITVGTVTAKPGAAVEVPVTIEANPGIVGIRLKLTYNDTVVKLTGVEDKGVIGGFIGLDSYGSGKYLSWMDNCVVEGDKVTKTIADKDDKDTGVIAVLKFQVLDSANIGDFSAITLTASGSYDIVNYDLKEVTFDIGEGKITVAEESGIEITIENMTKGNAKITAGNQTDNIDNNFTVSLEEGVIYVTCDIACSVFTTTDSTTYKVIKAEKTSLGYKFAFEVKSGLKVVIAIKGDIDGNAKVTLADYAKALSHVKRVTLITDPLSFACGDVDGNGSITLADYAKILSDVKRINRLSF